MQHKDPICGMDVDGSTGFKLKKDGVTYYFCSKRCMEKFYPDNKGTVEACVSCGGTGGMVWYKNKLLLASLASAAVIAVSYVFDLLAPFRNAFYMYMHKIWWAILAGFILGGFIDYYIPREYISKVLSKRSRASIFSAVLLGFFMSACSHGILALSMELHKKGASNPAVVAFLLASPWANLPLTFMLIGFFGLKALYIILSALFIAVVTGLIFILLEKKGLIESNTNSIEVDESFSIVADIKRRCMGYRFSLINLREDAAGVIKGSFALADMVMWWLLVGMLLASAASAYIPEGLFRGYMGPTFLGLLVTLILATILEVCSEGTAPLAFEIYRQTSALGNAFVFLMAGVVTDYTEIGLLWLNVGRRVAIWLPVVTVPQVVILGIVANIIF